MSPNARLRGKMQNPATATPKKESPIVTGVWLLAVFIGACSIAAGHTALGGVFPFVALAAAVTMGVAISNAARRS
jgi:hypothetical protein